MRTRDGMEGLGVDDGKMDRSARAMRGVQMKKEGIRTDHRRDEAWVVYIVPLLCCLSLSMSLTMKKHVKNSTDHSRNWGTPSEPIYIAFRAVAATQATMSMITPVGLPFDG